MDWRELLQCAVCLRPFDVVRLPVSLICGHTICCPCLSACSLHAPTSADTSNSRHGKASLAPSRSFASKDEHGFHSGAPEGLWKTNGHNGDKNGYWPDGKNVGSGHGDIKTYGNMRSYQCPLDQVLHKIPLVELPVNLSFLRILRIPFGSNTTNNRSLCGHVLSGFGSSNGQYDEREIEMMYRAGASSERPDGPQQMPSWMFAGLHGRDDDFGNQQYSQEKSLLVREDATEEQIPLPHSTDRNDFTRTSNGDEVHLSGSANSETEEDAYRGAQEALNSLASVMSLRDTGYPPQVLNKPLQRKILALLQCQIALPEGRMKCIRAARSVCERVVVELIVQHQNQQQLTSHLWSAVRARGCQFLGPAMQEEVLKLVLLALETGSALSRKVLVMFIVQKLKPQYPQASKTSVGHVVQLLYRASCFKVSKRDGDSSLMELKDEFRTYDALRKEHDAQIIQIAQEAGLRIAPEQWSALLYGDHLHKSLMQSIIDKLQSTQFFAQSVQELLIAVQRSGDPGNLCSLRSPLDQLASLDTTPDVHSAPEKKEAPSMHVVATTVNNIVRVITTFLAFMNAALLKKELLHPARMRAGAESTENMLCLNRTEPTGHPTHQSLSATRSLPQHIIGQNNGVDGFSGHLMDNGTMSVVDLNRLISRPNPVSLHVLKMSPPSVGENQNVSPHNTTRNPLLNGLASPGSLRPISRQVSAPVRTRLDCYSQSPPSHNLYSGARFQNNNSCHQENGSFSLEEDFYSAQARGKREQAALSQSTHKALQASNSLSNSFSSDLWNGSSVHGHVENGPRNRSTKLTPPLAFSRRMPASSGNLLDEFARWRDDASTSQGIHRISSLSNDLHRLHISRSAVFENDSLRPSYADNCSNIPLDYPYQDLSTIGKSFSSLSGDTPHMLRNQQRQADMDTSNRNWETCLFSLADEESQADRLNM